MRYDIILTKSAGNGYTARPLLWPEVVVSGHSEAEAVAGVRAALADVLEKSRIVQIDLPEAAESTVDPWLQMAGIWKDLPAAEWDQFQAAITAARQAANTDTTE